MRPGTLPEKRPSAAILLAGAIALVGAALGCGSDHHVSPWGALPGPTLAAYAARPDLPARLAAVDAEAAALRLARSFERRVELPRGRGPAVIRGYAGLDAGGRAVHAVRVATGLGVVLALGPLDPGDLERRAPTALVAGLPQGGDLNGDGLLDVVVRAEDGALAVWHFDALGSGPYAIAMAAPPLRALDIDGDGRLDLEGEIAAAPGDPLAPRLLDVATYEAGRYSDASPSARAWHAKKARDVPAGKGPEAALRAALERAWHTILAGSERGEIVLSRLRAERVPAALSPWFERSVRLVAAIQPTR
jgi:hypothetical protein